jgi:hypothetical protein
MPQSDSRPPVEPDQPVNAHPAIFDGFRRSGRPTQETPKRGPESFYRRPTGTLVRDAGLLKRASGYHVRVGVVPGFAST